MSGFFPFNSSGVFSHSLVKTCLTGYWAESWNTHCGTSVSSISDLDYTDHYVIFAESLEVLVMVLEALRTT